MTALDVAKKKQRDWPVWALLLAIYIGIPGLALFVGFVKFMAWWRVAFGDCTCG